MSQRPRPPAAQRPHVHCESCYSRRCRARPEVSVCCALAPCPLLCGAVFHLCKGAEHSLLCPNQRVPCLNAEYGCPLALTRQALAAHLRSCPASVVCCSMEWNRWPADDGHAHPRRELHDNLLLEHSGGASLDLDLAMALRDQDHLFHSLKMKTLFPELCESRLEERDHEDKRRAEEKMRKKDDMEEKERREAVKREARADGADCGDTWDHMSWINIQLPEDSERRRMAEEEEEEPSQEEREAIARRSGMTPEVLQSYAAWERMFSMDMGGCREVAGGAAAAAAKRSCGAGMGAGLGTLREEEPETTTTTTAAAACVAKRRGRFVYSDVEPMKIINIRTFKVPTSFVARQSRSRHPAFYKKESRGVDTSDLGVGMEDMPVWQEVQASLLCSLEKEQRGHLIAEGMCTDTLLQDEGTQTYNFLSVPFASGACLADLTVGRPPELHLQLQLEGVTSRHHKASSAFTFLCGHSFPRREYGKHFRNVHSDIQTCVSGWFEQRCPLAYLGCTYSQRRFQPSSHKATVTYNRDMSCFSLRPTLPGCLAEDSNPPGTATAPPVAQGESQGGRRRRGEESLSALPYEVLCHVASFLDSLSLSQLALVSRLLRDVCSSLLQDRGMVTLRWQKKTYSHGGAKWRVGKKVWEFSTMFSPVSEWCFQDVPHMSEHLKVCPFYQREHTTQRIHLPCVGEDFQTKTLHKNPTLVTAFKKKLIM